MKRLLSGLRALFSGLKEHLTESKIESGAEAPLAIERPWPFLFAIRSINAFLYFNPDDHSEAFLIDCGVGFDDNGEENRGAYFGLPSEIEVNWQRIKAVILSHAHQDHWSLIRFKPADIPVYCTPLAERFLNFQAGFEPGLWWSLKDLRVFDPYSFFQQDSIVLGSLTIRVFPVPHSIPEAVGFYFKLGNKNVVHLGEFKFEGERRQLEHSLRKLGKEGVDLLVVDVQNIESPGFTFAEQKVLESLRAIISGTPGRVFVTCFSSNLERINGLLEIASDLKRPVLLDGISMVKAITVGGMTERVRESLSFPFRNPALILIAGSQAEEGSALWKEAYGSSSSSFLIKSGDTLIFSSRAIPSPKNEDRLREIIQKFQSRGIRVIVNTGESQRLRLKYLEEALVHVSGHASSEDIKLALKLLKPRYVFPRPPVPAVIECLRQITRGKVKIIDKSIMTF